jgi:acetate kinase
VRVLVVNVGSSSVKLGVLDGDELLGQRDLDAPSARIDERTLNAALDALPAADVVAHRIVHGGTRFHAATRVDGAVEEQLVRLGALAPLHQPKSLAGLHAVRRARPELPAVACFDTAFHATMPAAARTYALPAAWRERFGLLRYGFHGLSHAYAARRAEELLGASGSPRRLVSCHLGAGASLAAIGGGRCVDTTMGFTPLEGLVMATRSGSVDPGMMLWLSEQEGFSAHELSHGLEHESGLLGLCGSADMREVLVRERDGDPDAALAVEVYLHRLRAGIAAMAAALGGLDALLFTGGVGEHSPEIRARCADGLGFLRVDLDEERNASARGDAVIGQGPAPVLVVTAREDLQMARETRALLGSS